MKRLLKGVNGYILVFAYPSTLNGGAPIAGAHSILGVTDQIPPLF